MLTRARSGFTLIELLVVVVIIGILASIGVKGFGSAQDRARNSSMVSNVRTVALGVENWKTDNPGLPAELHGTTPTGATSCLAYNAQTVPQEFPRYVPGGLLPKTPWARVAQVQITDSTYTNAGLLGGGGDGSVKKAIMDADGAIDLIKTGPQRGAWSIDSANNNPGEFPPATGPEERKDYGFIFYAGSGDTGRYVVGGVCKIEGKPVVTAVKSNF